MLRLPGIIISSPNSGSGKTIITLGILRALKNKGYNIQPFKNGPDYIDPAFHKIAANETSFNLDTWAMDNKYLHNLILKTKKFDLAIVEGSMGLFDGVKSIGASGSGKTAELAEKFGWSVVLVLNVSGQAQSAAATALGYIQYNKKINFAGVILNFVASERHKSLIQNEMKKVGIKILGVIPRQKKLFLPERHLGLVQAQEINTLQEKIQSYANLIDDNIDLKKLVQSATSNKIKENKFKPSNPPAQRISIAYDKAFSFIYPHILENWSRAGAEISFFSPLNNEVPQKKVELIWLPGGYPELFARELTRANKTRQALRNLSKTTKIHGECGGYMSLGEMLIDNDGNKFKMFDLLGLVTSYKDKKLHLGYRIARNKKDEKNRFVWGHEFHYSSIVRQPDEKLYEVTDSNYNKVCETGSVRGNVSGTFFHVIAGME